TPGGWSGCCGSRPPARWSATAGLGGGGGRGARAATFAAPGAGPRAGGGRRSWRGAGGFGTGAAPLGRARRARPRLPFFSRRVLCGVAWKRGTELLRPLAGEPAWEVVERWSNYTAPLALLYVRGWPTTARQWLGLTPSDDLAAPIAQTTRRGGQDDRDRPAD